MSDKPKVDALDALCPFRRCYHAVEWRGHLIKGVGYRYAPREAWHWRCETREQHGCPDPLPEPDPNKARCCHAPAVRLVVRGTLPRRQRCLTCGAWLSGWLLEAVRAGRLVERHPCVHAMAEPSILRPGWWECPSWVGGCRGAWDHKPKAHELPQATTDDLYSEAEP